MQRQSLRAQNLRVQPWRIRGSRRRTIVAAVAAMALGSGPALADAALYVAVPAAGLRDGFAYGIGYDYPNVEQAKEGGLSKCKEQAEQYDVDPTLCKLVDVFKKKCAAVAMDSVNRWAGWAIDTNQDAVSKSALAACSKNAPACEVADVVCDTK